jgi:hypothetical protein
MNDPILGQTITFRATFPAVATAVHLYLRSPLGVSSEVANTADGGGLYHADWVSTAAGVWVEHWEGVVGGRTYMEESEFTVGARQVPFP